MWLLSNIAGENAKLRDDLLKHDILNFVFYFFN